METTYKREEIKQHAIDGIDDLIGYDSNVYGADLHHELFNTDYYIIGVYQAKKWLGDMVFDVIDTIKEYEQDNFGEVNTDLSNPEAVVNMYAYIVGEEVLQDSETLHNKWDVRLSDDDLKQIQEELS